MKSNNSVCTTEKMPFLEALPINTFHSSWGDIGRIGSIALLAGAVLLAHYLTPPTHKLMAFHDVYERLMYIPIFLASFWFGWRGGMISAVTIAIAYIPHVHHDWGGLFLGANTNRTLEAVMYLVVGGITGLLIDRLRRANSNLLSQSEKLSQALLDLTAKTKEVFEAEEHLRRADRLTALGQLTAGLAHEIRNPLGSIQGSAEILSQMDPADTKREKFFHILIEETKRLNRVVSSFLDYAREQRNSAEYAHGSVAAVIDRLKTLLGAKLLSSRVELVVNLESELSQVKMSEAFLQQVLLNLILNAVQAMPQGGTIEVDVKSHSNSNQVVILLRDTGPGIPAEFRSQIFNPFFTTKSTGTGLGLSIVHKIMASHQGAIDLVEGQSVGATFRLSLPAA